MLKRMNAIYSLVFTIFSIFCIIGTILMHYYNNIGIVGNNSINFQTIIVLLFFISTFTVLTRIYLDYFINNNLDYFSKKLGVLIGNNGKKLNINLYNQVTVAHFMISVILASIIYNIPIASDIVIFTKLGEIWYFILKIWSYTYIIWLIFNFYILSGIEPETNYGS